MGKHDWVLSMFLKAEIKVLARLLYGVSGKDYTINFTQVVDRFQFCAAIGQRHTTPPPNFLAGYYPGTSLSS